MRTLYFDCFSGISGDMSVGAMLDLGVPHEYLIENLNKLGISEEFQIKISKKSKCGIEGTDFDVILSHNESEIEFNKVEEYIKHNHGEAGEHVHVVGHSHEHEHEHKHEHEHEHTHEEALHGRNLFTIEALIDKSELNENIKRLSKDIFKKVAEAEAIVHGKSLYDVHFHEVGAVDSIVDIVGAAICVDYLKPDRVISSPINTGSGYVKCQHGIIPVPAPATLQILKDVPIYCDEREFELTTPTGAAIIKVLSEEYRKLSGIVAKRIGYGCGKKETEKPNLLRVILSEDEFEETSILEATIDDMNPQIYGFFMDKLLKAGAKDVYFTPVYMKKNRPGIVVTITTPVKLEGHIKDIIFNETTTIGIRKFEIQRTELQREFRKLQTDYGSISYKVARYNDKIVNITPEFEDVRQAAENFNVSLKEVLSAATSAARTSIV